MAIHAPRAQVRPSANTPALCGVWPGPTRSTAVLLDPLTKLQLPISLANTEQARCALLTWLANQRAHLVIPDTLLAQPFLNQASQTPLTVWITPSALLQAIRFTTGFTNRPPKQTAAVRDPLPTAPALRPFLRRLTTSHHPEQLPLL